MNQGSGLSNHILQFTRYLENGNFAIRYRYRFSRPGIPRHPGFPVFDFKSPEPSYLVMFSICKSFGNTGKKTIYRLGDFLLRQSGPAGNVLYDLRFCHRHPPPCIRRIVFPLRVYMQTVQSLTPYSTTNSQLMSRDIYHTCSSRRIHQSGQLFTGPWNGNPA